MNATRHTPCSAVFLLAAFLFFLTPAGCKEGGRTADIFTQEIYTPRHAHGFRITGAEGWQSTLVSITDPWQGAKGVEALFFVARGEEEPPRDFRGVVIPEGAQRIVCLSSSYIAMLEALGETRRVAGVSGIDFVANPRIQARRDWIADFGAEMNYEQLLATAPDLVLLYGVADAQSTLTDRLAELGIPYMYMAEYLEASPLGKAEWVVALAEVLGMRGHGVQVFDSIPVRYDALRRRVAEVATRPVVMLNSTWEDSWVMPPAGSYMPQLIRDAGGTYAYPGNRSNRSEAIGLETAYRLLREADVWLNAGSAQSLAELKAQLPKFADAKSIATGKVYNNNLRLTPGGGNDFWESGVMHPDIVLRDLIRILHPEVERGELYYYRHLE